MGLRTKIASIIGVALLTVSMGTAALAQQVDEVPIDVTVGKSPDSGLTFDLRGLSQFDNVPQSFNDR